MTLSPSFAGHSRRLDEISEAGIGGPAPRTEFYRGTTSLYAHIFVQITRFLSVPLSSLCWMKLLDFSFKISRYLQVDRKIFWDGKRSSATSSFRLSRHPVAAMLGVCAMFMHVIVGCISCSLIWYSGRTTSCTRRLSWLTVTGITGITGIIMDIIRTTRVLD